MAMYQGGYNPGLAQVMAKVPNAVTSLIPTPILNALETPPPPPPDTPPQETVLYDPANPALAFVPAEFGPQIRVDAQGNIIGDPPATGYAATIIPLLTIVGHGWYLISRLFG